MSAVPPNATLGSTVLCANVRAYSVPLEIPRMRYEALVVSLKETGRLRSHASFQVLELTKANGPLTVLTFWCAVS